MPSFDEHAARFAAMPKGELIRLFRTLPGLWSEDRRRAAYEELYRRGLGEEAEAARMEQARRMPARSLMLSAIILCVGLLLVAALVGAASIVHR
ncbi:hypothetical protein [Sphingomonas sp.]|uniref:hypothetical protein n=1 Tax=Sphingomonas sp. TaxID=28214 RepID=UPI003CC569C5